MHQNFVSSLKISSFVPPTHPQGHRVLGNRFCCHFKENFDFDFELTKLMALATHKTPHLLGTHILIMPSEVCTRHLSTSLPTRIYLHACPWWQRRAAHQSPKGASAYSTNAMKKNPQSFLTLSYRARNNTFFLLQSAETWILEICKYYQIKKRRRPMITKNWDLI